MKKVYLLDTNIVSEFSRKNPDSKVIETYERRKELCAISAITWQELIFGVTKIPEGKRKDYIKKCLEEFREAFEIIPYDGFAAEICGQLCARSEQDGKTLPYIDSQIAATAIANGMVLVTHNVTDFKEASERSFLKVEDWFSVA